MLRPPTHGARASVPRANAAACRTGTPWEEEPSPLALSQVGSVQSRGLGFFWAGVVASTSSTANSSAPLDAQLRDTA